jgi:cell division protein FtsB
MRAAVLVILAILAGAALLVLVLARAGNGVAAVPGLEADRERIESIEKSVAGLRQELDELRAAIRTLSDENSTLEERIAAVAQENPKRAPQPADGRGRPDAASGESPTPVEEASAESEWLRELVCKEIALAEEEKRRKLEEERKAQIPEEWEKDEFSHYAWQIHNMGNRLGLSDAQKRQYHGIVKEHDERVRQAWQELRDANPSADMRELSKLYQDRTEEMLRTTREMVANILTGKQRGEYEQLCKDSPWTK